MGDLFSDAAGERLPETAPLALRVRPATLEAFVGQRHVLGDGSALLSRCQIYELEPLALEDVETVVRRGLAELGAETTDELVELLARKAGGDARTALNTVELAWRTAEAEGTELEERHVEDAARKR